MYLLDLLVEQEAIWLGLRLSACNLDSRTSYSLGYYKKKTREFEPILTSDNIQEIVACLAGISFVRTVPRKDIAPLVGE